MGRTGGQGAALGECLGTIAASMAEVMELNRDTPRG
jgi:hypothetical protein